MGSDCAVVSNLIATHTRTYIAPVTKSGTFAAMYRKENQAPGTEKRGDGGGCRACAQTHQAYNKGGAGEVREGVTSTGNQTLKS